MNRSARLARIKEYRQQLIAEIGTISIDDAARALHKERKFVTNAMDTGKLPFIQLGKQRRIRVVDLEAFLAALARESQARAAARTGSKPKPPLSSLRHTDPGVAALFV